MIGRMPEEPSLPARRAGTPWWVPVALLFGGIVIVALVVMVTLGLRQSAGWGYDFAAYYEAALRLVATGSPYQAETLNGPFRPGPGGLYLYSPLPALLIAPLTALGPDTATLAWFVGRVLLLVATCLLMPVPRWVKLATLGVAAISPQFLHDLNLGNVSVIVTFLAVVVWRFLDRPIGGLALAASMTIRPAMGAIWLWWLVRRQWRAALATVAGLAIALLASLPFVGLDSWLDYATVLRNLGGTLGVQRNLDFGSTALALGAPASLANLALIGGYIVAIGAIVVSLRRDREISFAVTLMATLLLTPLLWDHYLTNLIVPAALVASRGRRFAVLLPLLGWLPLELLPFVTVAGMLLPFAVKDRGAPSLPLAHKPKTVADLDAGLGGTARA